MDQQIQREWAERAVRAVNQAFPDVEFNVWARCEHFLPHAQVCAMHICEQALHIREHSLKEEHPDVATSVNNLGRLYHHLGRFTDAELLYQRALKICEQTKPLYHPRTVDLLQSYANMLRMAKRKTKAVEIEGRIKEMQMELSGEQP